ncbi:MAG: glycerol kinase GlpK [Defluviitaleaceae bacterium]|nr:glycerol kinase GlpK [Defluviitaleaceae bacterium]
MKYLMALDSGTTNIRAIIFNREGEVVSLAQKEHLQFFPKPGWVEHDPMQLWSNQLGVIIEARAKIGAAASDIAAIGITNQRETTLVWDKNTGKPIYNAIVWQCRRNADYCQELRNEGYDEVIREKTGLTIDAYFSATKLRWILDNVPGARQDAEAGNLMFGTIDTWLIYQLTGGKVFATDYSNASRTMMFNIHDLCWDKEILEKFDIPIGMLPEVRPSSGNFGNTMSEFLGGEIPIMGVVGDQQAALFGQGCLESGMVKNTYGTGCFVLMNTGKKAINSNHGLITTIAWGLGEGEVEYALEGSVFTAGAAIQWLRDGLDLIKHAAETEKYAMEVESNKGIYIVPAFTGLGAPYWNQYAKGIISGLTPLATKNHIIRATLESIAYQSHDVISAMVQENINQDAENTENGNLEIRVDGGVSNNDFLMQFQADISNARIVRSKTIESTALGAALLAGLSIGFYADKSEIANIVSPKKVFKPQMDVEKRETLLAGWREAVSRAIGCPGCAFLGNQG